MEYNLIRGMTKDGSARFCILDSENILKEARRIHGDTVDGRLLSAVSLIACLQGEKNNYLTVNYGGFSFGGDYYGNVKCCPRREDDGLLSIVREDGSDEPFYGSVESTGHVAKDFAQYFAESEQTPTVFALCDKGGILIQLLPFADEDIISQLEKNLPSFSHPKNLFPGDLTKIAEIVMKDIDYDLFDQNFVEYKCDCSREKMAQALASIKKEELIQLAEEQDGKISVSCKYCDKIEYFTKDEIEKL